jgi:ectoine hydroxylase-related dioxygenase (phytanoyl-CoA dioxygenase family)
MDTAAAVEHALAAIDRDGCCILESAVDGETVEAAHRAITDLLAATPYGRNPFEGRRTQRVYSLLAKTRAVDPLALHPVVLGVADALLGTASESFASRYWLSATVAIAIAPGEEAQAVHFDDALYPLPHPHDPVELSAMWAIDDFREENGATVFFPGSHRSVDAPPPGAARLVAEMPAGSVALYLGSLWHHAGPNRSDAVRIGLTFDYLAAWLRQQENQVLAVPPDRARALPPRLVRLLGYSVHPPFTGYVDGRDPARLLGDAAGGEPAS